MLGSRVVRGPDWRWDDQDGGEGSAGTIITTAENDDAKELPEKTVKVRWDHGQENCYMIGVGGCLYDLRILDSSTSGVVFADTKCNGCSDAPIKGSLWKCHSDECIDYHLCTICYMSDVHSLEHTFICRPHQSHKGILVGKRSMSKRVQARGIFPGAKVVRINEDDHEKYGVGNVYEVKTDSMYKGIQVSVCWEGVTDITTHNFGLDQDKINITLVDSAEGPLYYKAHLPLATADDEQHPAMLGYDDEEHKKETNVIDTLAAFVQGLTHSKTKKGKRNKSDSDKNVKKEFKMILGSRVVRGPDFCRLWGEQDGGEGNVGTIIITKENDDSNALPDQMVRVRWDNGQENTCIAGLVGWYDLRILDSSSSGVVFEDTKCNGCSDAPIKGSLWKCHSDECIDYHLCTKCYMSDVHSLEHTFICRPHQSHKGVLVGQRSMSKQIQASGIFPGAEVMRSNEEEQANYGIGNVFEVKTDSMFKGIQVGVCWAKADITTHKFGPDQEKIDITLVKSGEGPLYYKSHLPLAGADDIDYPAMLGCDDDQNKKESDGDTLNRHLALLQALKDSNTRRCKLKVGDKVVIHLKKNSKRVYESNLGGDEAAKIVGEIGIIVKVKPNGKVHVKFNSLPNVWKFPHDNYFSKISKLRPGDNVRLTDNIDALKKMQEGYGEFDDNMEAYLGKCGVVTEVDQNGTAKVNFEGTSWNLNSAAVVRESNPEGTTDGDKSEENESDGDENDTSGLSALAKALFRSKTKRSKLKIGDNVVIHLKKDVKRVYESNLSGNEAAEIVGENGRISKVKPNGKVHVKFKSLPYICKFPDGNYFSKISKLSPGDNVRLTDNIDALKKMQEGYGEFDDNMEAYLGKCGVVTDVDEKGTATYLGKCGVVTEVDQNGTATVNFEGTSWTLNSAVVIRESNPEGTTDGDESEENESDSDENDASSLAALTKALLHSKKTKGKKLKVGDKVAIHLKKDVKKLYDSNLNGKQAAKFVGEIGKVTEVKSSGGVSVQFKSFQENWSFPDPTLFSKVSKLCPGDVVRLTDNVDALKKMQEGHGGFNYEMMSNLDTSGVVTEVDQKGTATVNFEGTSWYLNSAAVIRESNLEGRTDEDESKENDSDTDENQLGNESIELVKYGMVLSKVFDTIKASQEGPDQTKPQTIVDPDSKEVYKMKSSPRGLMVIINMKTFTPQTNLIERKGSDKDEHALYNVFRRKLDFDVWPILKDKRRLELLQELRVIAECEDNKRYDCLAVCIMSHGEVDSDGNDVFFTSDSRLVKLKQVLTMFTNTDCEVFRGKPKLFFIQACRGDLGKALKSEEPSTASDAILDGSESGSKEETSQPKRKDPDMADMVIAHSSFDGYTAHRDTDEGSVFIQKLAKVFSEFADKEHIADLMTRVNEAVHTDIQDDSTGRTQVPTLKSTLRKKLYFWPTIKFDR